ncbi:MAG: type II toxin-antitoxin system HicA family toxin [Planctomycetes bacterium]|nr:type II toxin-antitoxin system HicA family toxin [Planctomycetota bacterium]
MSPRLRVLSGREVVAILGTFGFQEIGRKGSHVKMRRPGPSGERQTLVVPDHGTLDRGTLRAILRQASAYIPQEHLWPQFRG